VTDPLPDCLADPSTAALALHPVRPGGLEAFLASLPPLQAGFLRGSGFTAAAQQLVLLPGEGGLAGAALGLGASEAPEAFGDLAYRLPEGTAWRLAGGDYDADTALLGALLGAYRYRGVKPPKRPPARFSPAAGAQPSIAIARAICRARDLINTPANLLGPAELAEAVQTLAAAHGAAADLVTGAALDRDYPAIAAVGAGSARPPVMARLDWRGSTAPADAPLIALCGKGVVFDTGGYDLKPSSAMLRMKKDMGGAAVVLGIAEAVMAADLPVRLSAWIGAVENSVSGSAMRPLDVIRTRAGLSVEIGNTDAEGRLVLCDLLADAAVQQPTLLLDCATLTGAARVALGPDLPALFCNDEPWAARLLASGMARHDPLWRLPLWDGYADWLNSPIADLGNVSSKPFAGAIVAALFLRRFIPAGIPWAHIDLYAWNDQTRPAHPEGGEGQAIRAVSDAIRGFVIAA
jgi:leucyl aminopeptidase